MLVWSGTAPPLCLSIAEITETLYSYFGYAVELYLLIHFRELLTRRLIYSIVVQATKKGEAR